MTKYDLCNWLKQEFRQINPRDLARATRLMVRLSVECAEPERFKQLFALENFDKTPVPRREPTPEINADWSNTFDFDEDARVEATEMQPEVQTQCL